MLPQYPVVVNFSVDSQSNGSFIVDERLCACVDTNDTETFMAEDGVVSDPVARPIWTSMSQAFDAGECLLFELLDRGVSNPES